MHIFDENVDEHFDDNLKKFIKAFPLILIILVSLVSFNISREILINTLGKIESIAQKINLTSLYPGVFYM
mgnify:CR=1 FL=1